MSRSHTIQYVCNTQTSLLLAGKFETRRRNTQPMDFVSTVLTHHQANMYLAYDVGGLAEDQVSLDWQKHCCYTKEELAALPVVYQQQSMFSQQQVSGMPMNCSTLVCQADVDERGKPIVAIPREVVFAGDHYAKVFAELEALYTSVV